MISYNNEITVLECLPKELSDIVNAKHERFDAIDYGGNIFDVIVKSVIDKSENNYVNLHNILECDIDTAIAILNECNSAWASRPYLY